MDKKQISEKSKSHGSIISPKSLEQDIKRHIMLTLGNDYFAPKKSLYYKGLAYSVRDRLIERWLKTQRSYYDKITKRIYYLSLEFLPGRFLMNYIINMDIKDECNKALEKVGFTLEDLEEEEWDAGLGNGGLGRLASCFMDSIATLKMPGYGYGIRYDYGIFFQTIVNGFQVEQCDNWVRDGNPWEIKRGSYLYEIKFYGRSEPYIEKDGRLRYRWVDTDNVMAMACDIFIPGYCNDNVNNMRLWAATSSRDFNLEYFNQGDYIRAIEAKVMSENISKVLYPSDEGEHGKELRLRQQYFFVAATFQDIIRRFKKKNSSFDKFPDEVGVQLNDTHPAISIPELMRILMDEEELGWDESWNICNRTFAYTNHTILPEALETWPVDLLEKMLPRHLEIIYEINQRFLKKVKECYPENQEILSRLSLIQEAEERRVRMAHLAIVGSHSVNGVSRIHTNIIKNGLFKEFDKLFPGRIKNITNGISPRRWLLQANPALSQLITSVIGSGWITDLCRLKELIPYADDPEFCVAWQKVKKENKERLANYVMQKVGIKIDPDTLFDVHVKRIHEYKRQLLNILHVITLYNRLKEKPKSKVVPRTIIFSGKSSPGYFLAKLIIKLINSVAEIVNNDPYVNKKLKVIFLPNYCVSKAEKIVPATDLSEQISTAGTEASGTGNMKFALNGALIIGTLDGANMEIMEEVGEENIFIFGLKQEEVEKLRSGGYNPYNYYLNDQELKKILDMISYGYFSPEQPRLFWPIREALLDKGDKYFVLADYRQYVQKQEEASSVYRDVTEWNRRTILNTANMGKFSSDRAILEYARKVWGLRNDG
ncbi:MAG: glycogen/starch/alpha-glucan phosphorylase [Proteobacteria bacterium]|nr:glycogen/starch/alpha-glucan phosphorylase [Pseudomonadota bacterium]MBU4068976.1 glycogen/starch/alpha-glucan phosphorylase [Pseudomonadota bacterium]